MACAGDLVEGMVRLSVLRQLRGTPIQCCVFSPQPAGRVRYRPWDVPRAQPGARPAGRCCATWRCAALPSIGRCGFGCTQLLWNRWTYSPWIWAIRPARRPGTGGARRFLCPLGLSPRNASSWGVSSPCHPQRCPRLPTRPPQEVDRRYRWHLHRYTHLSAHRRDRHRTVQLGGTGMVCDDQTAARATAGTALNQPPGPRQSPRMEVVFPIGAGPCLPLTSYPKLTSTS